MGASKSLPQTETINWKNLKTDQISDIPNLYGISDEANRLVQKINVPELSDSSISDLDNIFLSKINNTNTNSVNNQASEHFSNTSPFISSEMYNYVMNKYQQQNMVGGAGEALDSDSETSSTSSSSISDSSKSSSSKSSNSKLSNSKLSSEKHVKKQLNAKGNKLAKKNKLSNQKTLSKKINKNNSEAYLDYISSSAHTGGSITDNSSVINDNNITVSSVRTSQINLISE